LFHFAHNYSDEINSDENRCSVFDLSTKRLLRREKSKQLNFLVAIVILVMPLPDELQKIRG
jgi:hypothetical protein